MSKLVQGISEIGAAVGMGVLAFVDPAVMAMPAYWKITYSLVAMGVGSLISAAAQALTGTGGTNITTQQAAGFKPICYGERQVPGTMIYQSTTGSHHDQDNSIIVVCGHPIHAFVSLYLDGRLVQWVGGSADNKTFGGISFGGNAGGGTLIGPTGAHYNFDTLCFADAYDGTQTMGTYSTAMQANDPTWAPSANGTPSVMGCAYAYLKIEYDSSMFPSRPQIRWVIQGRNDIYDPRTGTRGYTTNWALIIADVLMNTDYGMGTPQSSINTAQWIAAANVCDEVVACAVGVEARYTCNWTGDTSSPFGDILSQMMTAAGGRLTYANAQWYIWPAYWQPASFTWDESSLVSLNGESVGNWNPYRKGRDLFNRVSGTYVAPWYPYNVSGNLYDHNGWYDGTTADTFPLAWQPTTYPTYAQDSLHGYSSDQWLIADGNRIMYKDLSLPAVLSVSQAQRLAKIELLMNRWQGVGTLQMCQAAYQMMPADVMEITLPDLGWNNKVLEVTGVRYIPPQAGQDSEGIPTLSAPYVQVDVRDTDASIYAWSEEEELTIQSTPVLPYSIEYTPAPPTDVVLSSSAATAVRGIDGIVTPRVMVTWDSPLDNMSKTIGIQYQLAGASSWIDAPSVPTDTYETLVSGVTAGQTYNFQVRSLRANGAASAWVGVLGYTVSTTYSSVETTGILPNIPANIANDVIIDSVVGSGSASIRIYGVSGGVGSSWNFTNGATTIVEPAATLTGLAYATTYTVILDSVSSDYAAYTSYTDTLPDRFIPLGYMTTVASGGTGGTSGGGGAPPVTGGGGGTTGGGGGPRQPPSEE
jgi:hypothetical protein